ncbi:MAG: hypothetical protein ICV83_25250 [Cytophagales bacterium]|nr:hypothetical protein [Cytophagales bacterium]
MRKHVYCLIVSVLLTMPVSAKIWRVNNNTGVAADFTTLQAAHDGAANGDTLHVEGSATSYGALTLTKKLVIIGPGYYLGENPDTQALKLTAKAGYIRFFQASAGSVLMGMDMQGQNTDVHANDITIKRNLYALPNGNDNPEWGVGAIYLYYQYSGSGNLGPIANIFIVQNYGARISNSYAATGVLITNNFLTTNSYVDPTTNWAVTLDDNTEAILKNNVIRGKVQLFNSNVTNNILFAGTFEKNNNLVSNNLGSGTQFDNANGNKQNVDMATVFVGAGEGVSTDGRWNLKAGSPAIGAGYGSTPQNRVDAGMFSGSTPYVLSGMPPVPSVYFFENQPVGSSADGIDVTIRVKSRN